MKLSKIFFAILMLAVFLLLCGCSLYREPRHALINKSEIMNKYLNNKTYCQNDADCKPYCCTICANKYWVKENVDTHAECCADNPEHLESCICVNNVCTQKPIPGYESVVIENGHTVLREIQ